MDPMDIQGMTTYRTVSLDLEFRGSRDYLHGTSMHDALVAELKRPLPDVDGRLTLEFRRFARNQVTLKFSGHSQSPLPEDGVAWFSLMGGSYELHGYFVDAGFPVARREPYPEELVGGVCEFWEGGARCAAVANGFTAIEVLVAMTKEFHFRYRPSKLGRWIFSRLEVDRLLRPSDNGVLEIRLESEISGRITRNAVISNGGVIGNIVFTLVR